MPPKWGPWLVRQLTEVRTETQQFLRDQGSKKAAVQTVTAQDMKEVEKTIKDELANHMETMRTHLAQMQQANMTQPSSTSTDYRQSSPTQHDPRAQLQPHQYPGSPGSGSSITSSSSRRTRSHQFRTTWHLPLRHTFRHQFPDRERLQCIFSRNWDSNIY